MFCNALAEMSMKIERGLYAITQQGLPPASLFEKTQQIVTNGAVMVQYRAKTARDTSVARRLLEICHAAKTAFIVNDDPELALTIGADGVHLGAQDPDFERARTSLGDDAIIGVSCYNRLDRSIQAQRLGADYVAFGSFFKSLTKPGAQRAHRQLLENAKARLSIPVVAIGGITPENGRSLIDAGADLLAVISGLYASADAASVAASYTALFDEPI